MCKPDELGSPACLGLCDKGGGPKISEDGTGSDGDSKEVPTCVPDINGSREVGGVQETQQVAKLNS